MEQREVSANPRRIRPWDKQSPARSRRVHACFLEEAAFARNYMKTLGPSPVLGAAFLQIIRSPRDADAAWKPILWGERQEEDKHALGFSFIQP